MVDSIDTQLNARPALSTPRAPRVRWVFAAAVAFILCTLSFLGYIGLFGNFHEITPGKCYRSEQLKPQAIKDAIASRGIKSVLNLRGEQKNADWYKGELAACIEQNIDHADFNIGLGQLPKPETLQQLVTKLENGPYPMLLHCRSGSDRTGLASAFYLNIVEKKPLDDAEAEQVTWRYGHFGIGRAQSINAFFKLYHDTAHGQSLKDWLYKTYPAEYEKQIAGSSKVRVDD